MSLSRLALPLAAAVLLAFAPPPFKGKPSEQMSLLEIALAVNADSGEFSTLIAAAGAAGLADALDGKQKLTVFAPTDAAFAELDLDATNVGVLPQAELLDILLYHVTKGNRFSQSVVNAQQIKMLNGDKSTISSTSEGVFIDDARLLTPDLIDIDARNGVIHVIDSVLLPPNGS
ncbi:MAG: fasciclin domain-containing protein [Planctomycetota bacterium]|jgi:uncharacterized surface protein with fasciclin (FAS1) repeats